MLLIYNYKNNYIYIKYKSLFSYKYNIILIKKNMKLLQLIM